MFTKTRKIDYHNKKYNNPYFKTKKSKINFTEYKLNWKLFLILFTVILLISGLVWFMYFSSIFKIRSIETRGLTSISSQPITDLAWEQANSKRSIIASQNNIILFDTKKFVNTLERSYNLNSLNIDKNIWQKKIIINIKENEPAAVWLENNKYYLIDSLGNINKEILENIVTNTWPIINNQNEPKIINLKVNVDPIFLSSSIKIFKELKSKYQINLIIIDSDINTLKLSIKPNTFVYFSTINDIDNQLIKLDLVIKDMLKNNFKNINYIDLRYGDAVYIK